MTLRANELISSSLSLISSYFHSLSLSLIDINQLDALPFLARLVATLVTYYFSFVVLELHMSLNNFEQSQVTSTVAPRVLKLVKDNKYKKLFGLFKKMKQPLFSFCSLKTSFDI